MFDSWNTIKSYSCETKFIIIIIINNDNHNNNVKYFYSAN